MWCCQERTQYKYKDFDGGKRGFLISIRVSAEVPAAIPSATATNTKGGVAGFYLHGADRRSRHSDSLALGKQAGRFGGRTHAQGPKHIHTHTMPLRRWERKQIHSRGSKCSKEEKLCITVIDPLNAWRHTNTRRLLSLMHTHTHTRGRFLGAVCLNVLKQF